METLTGKIYFPQGSNPEMTSDETFEIKYTPSSNAVSLLLNGEEIWSDGGGGGI